LAYGVDAPEYIELYQLVNPPWQNPNTFMTDIAPILEEQLDAGLGIEVDLGTEESARPFVLEQVSRLTGFPPEAYSDWDLGDLLPLWYAELQPESGGSNASTWSGYDDPRTYLEAAADVSRAIHLDTLAEPLLENTYEPPDFTLLLFAASILFEPLDWGLTGIEIARDVFAGNYLSAAGNFALAIIPGVSGRTDDILDAARRADDLPLLRGDNNVNNIPRGIDGPPTIQLEPSNPWIVRMVRPDGSQFGLAQRSYNAPFDELFEQLPGKHAPPQDIVAIIHNPNINALGGPNVEVFWLEEGRYVGSHRGTGVVHIDAENHLQDIQSVWGVPDDQAAVDFITDQIAFGTPSITSRHGRVVEGRQTIDYIFEYAVETPNGDLRILRVIVGDNGYIVSAFPRRQ
jgi:hypothetical protein